MSGNEGGTIWLNVTLSHWWGRPPVGLVRVEREIAKGLADEFGHRLKLCVWDGHKFVEVSGSPQREHGQKKLSNLSSPENMASKEHKSVAWKAVARPRFEALPLLAQGIYSLLPEWLQKASYPIGTKILKMARKIALPSQVGNQSFSFAGSSDRDLGFALREENRVKFGKNDVFVSAGNDWDLTFDDWLGRERQRIGFKVVRFLYDLVPVLFPQLTSEGLPQRFTEHLISVAYSSDVVVCISERTREDLIGFSKEAGCPIPKTEVVVLGDNFFGSNSGGSLECKEDVDRNRLIDSDFIVFVSTIESRKNHRLLYHCYRWILTEQESAVLPMLVFVGKPGWNVSELIREIGDDPLVRAKILFLDHVSDQELHRLYKDALFVVYPSMYEGWGLPVAEALAAGKVVLASSAGALPEVGGDLVKYIDPYDTAAWKMAILDLIADEDLRRESEERVRKYYQVKPWSETARQLAQVLQDVSSTFPSDDGKSSLVIGQPEE